MSSEENPPPPSSLPEPRSSRPPEEPPEPEDRTLESVRTQALVPAPWGTVPIAPDAETMIPCPTCRKSLVDASEAVRKAAETLRGAGWTVRPPSPPSAEAPCSFCAVDPLRCAEHA